MIDPVALEKTLRSLNLKDCPYVLKIKVNQVTHYAYSITIKLINPVSMTYSARDVDVPEYYTIGDIEQIIAHEIEDLVLKSVRGCLWHDVSK